MPAKKKRSSKRKIWRIVIIALVILLLAALATTYHYFNTWKTQATAKALENSETVITSLGPIEYKSIGTGPVILLSHMGGSGSDNIVFFKRIAQAGFRVICPSRPGYLNTPLSVDADIEFQADMYAELLKALNIKEKVFVMGVSLGGPSAIEFAHKYPSKCIGLILHSAISGEYELGEEYISLYKKMTNSTTNDFFSWINIKRAEYFQQKHLESLLKYAVDMNGFIIPQMADYLATDIESTFHNLRFFDETTSPISIRIDGLKNDLKFAKDYKAKKINLPILITHSDVDKLVKLEQANKFKELNPKAELFTYEGFGHAFWFGEEWEKVKEKTIAFLKKDRSKPKPKKKVYHRNIVKLTRKEWANRDNGAILKIRTNGTFTMDVPGVDKNEFIKGRVNITKSQVTFYVNSKTNYCKNIKGVYNYRFVKDELHLEVVSDNCLERVNHFSAGWFEF